MVNKALEVIEAYHLFPIDKEQIEVVVHPESIIHSLVEYIDGAVLAELGNPDMRVPIAYALGWPERIALQHKRFDFTKTQSLNFEAVDVERFPALRVVRDVLEQGLAASIIFNGANEVAVRSFLNKEIHYCDIVPTIERSLEHLHIDKVDTLDDVLQAISYVEDSVNHLVKHGAF
jgi:1-deoxy-D-xylulose-5-phosphate reductoisomerase